jgi:hypothetical protein
LFKVLAHSIGTNDAEPPPSFGSARYFQQIVGTLVMTKRSDEAEDAGIWF